MYRCSVCELLIGAEDETEIDEPSRVCESCKATRALTHPGNPRCPRCGRPGEYPGPCYDCDDEWRLTVGQRYEIDGGSA